VAITYDHLESKERNLNKVETENHFIVLFMGDLWTVFSSYFGGKPSNVIKNHQIGLRILVFSILLTGNVVFMAYRASVTSELSVWTLKMPFYDLQGLLNRPDFR